MSVRVLQDAASEALLEHARVREKLASDAYAHLESGHAANLLGSSPAWATYVARLGYPQQPQPDVDASIRAFGSPALIRGFALRCLEVADAIEAVA